MKNLIHMIGVKIHIEKKKKSYANVLFCILNGDLFEEEIPERLLSTYSSVLQ